MHQSSQVTGKKDNKEPDSTPSCFDMTPQPAVLFLSWPLARKPPRPDFEDPNPCKAGGLCQNRGPPKNAEVFLAFKKPDKTKTPHPQVRCSSNPPPPKKKKKPSPKTPRPQVGRILPVVVYPAASALALLEVMKREPTPPARPLRKPSR